MSVDICDQSRVQTYSGSTSTPRTTSRTENGPQTPPKRISSATSVSVKAFLPTEGYTYGIYRQLGPTEPSHEEE